MERREEPFIPNAQNLAVAVRQVEQHVMKKMFCIRFSITSLLAATAVAAGLSLIPHHKVKRKSAIEYWENQENAEVWIDTNTQEAFSVSAENVSDRELESMRPFGNEIQWLALKNTTMTDEGMETINTFEKLYNLEIQGSSITDDWLRKLDATPDLQCVFLFSSQVTGAGFDALKDHSLLTVGVNDNPLSAEGLRTITRIPSITSLHVAGCNLHDDDLKEVATLSKLEFLDCSRNNITGAGLEHLRGLPLESLHIANCNLTDEDMKIIASLTGLWRLNLTGNAISWAGLEHLRNLVLQELEVENTLIETTDPRLQEFIKRDQSGEIIQR